jgi:predicted nucleotidyltransferase
MMTTDMATVVDRIRDRFQPLRTFLLGSYARGEATPDSNLDLLVVRPDLRDKHQTTVEIIRSHPDLPIAKDVVVTTPEEFEWRGRLVGTVLRPALREGLVLSERA